MTAPDTLPAIACIGAANDDRKLHLVGPYQPATSNPAVGTTTAGGVARNVAETLGRLGADVRFFGAVGQDGAGYGLVAGLKAAGVDTANLIHDPDRATGSYTAVVAPDGALVCGLADMTICDGLSPDWLATVVAKLQRCAIWCVDANLPAATLEALAAAAPAATRVFADPVSAAKAPRLATLLPRLAAVTPDRAEAAALTGQPVAGAEQALAAARALCASGVREAYVSLGPDGVATATAAGAAILPAFPAVPAPDVTGAGDAFLAGVVYGGCLAGAGAPPPVAFGLAANLALAVNTAVPDDLTAARLHDHVAAHWREPSPT